MYVVICHPEEDDINVFGTFDSEPEAEEWIGTINTLPDGSNNCPNEHYTLELLGVTKR